MEELMLLRVLENSARTATTDLADILNADEEEVKEKIEDLEKRKVICGYHTLINWDKTNHDSVMALIEVSATPERDSGYDQVAKQIYRYPEVSTCYLMSGRSEFIVIIKGRTMREIADFVGQKLAPIKGVTGTVTCFVLKEYKIEGVIMEEDEDKTERLVVTP